MPPSVSILMPVYAPEPAFLRAAIESVLRQSDARWTLAIREDPSDVRAESIVEPFLRDPRITFQRNERRRGIGGNWNECLRSATGEYIQYLFQDDIWKEEYLASCQRSLEEDPSVGMVVVPHTYRAMDPDAEEFMRAAGYDALPGLRAERLPAGTQEGTAILRAWLRSGLRPNLIGEPSFVMIRRSLTAEAGLFREDLPQALDVEYWTRLLPLTRVRVLDRNLGFFRVHSSGASMRHNAMGAGLFDRLRVFESLLRRLPPGELRAETRRVLEEQITAMGSKFRRRVEGGHRVGTGGFSAAIPFFMRHPLLLGRALVAALRKR